MSTLSILLTILACIACWSLVAEGFSTGAPVDACETLSPDPLFHGADPQSSDVPYEIDLSSLADTSGGLSYVPGDTYSCEQTQGGRSSFYYAIS